MTQYIHRGKQKIANPSAPFMFWECWCGARWLCPPLTHAYRWCPLAPAGSGASLPQHTLSVGVTQPDWAAESPLPYVIGVRVGSVGTTFASVATLERALLVAHALQATYGKSPRAFRLAW